MKDYSKANRGKDFEDFLKIVHQKYQQDGTACIHKVPTEFIPLRDYRGRITSCKVTEKSCVDYLGRYKDVPVAIEAKHETGNRISFDRVEPHQAAYLDDYIKNPAAVGIVVVSFGGKRFFSIPWEFWKVARNAWTFRPSGARKAKKVTITAKGYTWTTTGMASVSADELLPEWEIQRGGSLLLLPYLKIIDHMRRN